MWGVAENYEHSGQACVTRRRSGATISAACLYWGSSKSAFLSGHSQTPGIPARTEKRRGR